MSYWRRRVTHSLWIDIGVVVCCELEGAGAATGGKGATSSADKSRGGFEQNDPGLSSLKLIRGNSGASRIYGFQG